MKKIYLYIYIILFIASCRSSKPSAVSESSQYKRKPIVEVTESQLKEDGLLLDAATQELVGKREEAIKGYQQILAANPNNAAAHYELGKIYLKIGWVDSAAIHTKQACLLNGENTWYKLQMVSVYERKQDAKNYIATWEEIVKKNPDRPDYYYDLSNAYLMINNLNASIEVLDRVERKFGVNEAVSLQKQKLYEALGKPEKARKELEKLAEAIPNDTRYNAILAESYMGERNYAQALRYYQRILEYNPNDEDIQISLASCYLAMGNLQQTYAHLRSGVQNPNIECKLRLTYLTEFLRNKEFFTQYSKYCFSLADSIAAQCEGSTTHLNLYGGILASQGRYAEASTAFARHLEADNSSYDNWVALLMCEGMVSDTNESLLNHALQASELFPLQPRPYYILAKGYLGLGDCEKAKKYLDRCLMVAPNDTQINQLKQEINQSCK